jgi:hypothetical protein
LWEKCRFLMEIFLSCISSRAPPTYDNHQK